MLGDNLITTSFSFFIAAFNLLSCEFDSFVFKRLYCVDCIVSLKKLKNLNCIHKTFTVPCENSKIVFFCFFNNKEHCCISSSI